MSRRRKRAPGRNVDVLLTRTTKTAHGADSYTIRTQMQWEYDMARLFEPNTILQGQFYSLLLSLCYPIYSIFVCGYNLYSECVVNAASQCSMHERTEQYRIETRKETGSLLLKVSCLRNHQTDYSFLVSILYCSVRSCIEHCDAALTTHSL